MWVGLREVRTQMWRGLWCPLLSPQIRFSLLVSWKLVDNWGLPGLWSDRKEHLASCFLSFFLPFLPAKQPQPAVIGVASGVWHQKELWPDSLRACLELALPGPSAPRKWGSAAPWWQWALSCRFKPCPYQLTPAQSKMHFLTLLKLNYSCPWVSVGNWFQDPHSYWILKTLI